VVAASSVVTQSAHGIRGDVSRARRRWTIRPEPRIESNLSLTLVAMPEPAVRGMKSKDVAVTRRVLAPPEKRLVEVLSMHDQGERRRERGRAERTHGQTAREGILSPNA